ncbi:AAA family ATPase [Anabaena sp. PCC 7108]|uniref:AAA family ATPase n=1 Tax=Anabaena sp. PCC 7108 TaxID=163908 RepID=UPI00034BBAE3|nr:AAA family ATPase [Anabaena sp. PCC 7108]
MMTIPGYQIQKKIHKSPTSQVYRGIRERDSLPVIFKILTKEYPTPEEITRYKLEYEITHSLSLEGVIKSYDLQPYQNTFIIILEDFGGESLANRIATSKFTLTEFLNLAIQITKILNDIHSAKIIHKDINPSNIVFNSETQQLKIIDFGISTALSQETLTFKSPTVLEGTLAYISPEQTGRMNRCLDYRTDFYSLGVTFYQMLTGCLPFNAADTLEFIHCHIAKQPISPQQLNPNIPPVVADIVMKLLAKNAEDRYQSALGLKADLETCLTQWETNGDISHFAIGKLDLYSKFSIPQKLYGREAEVATLLAAFERVSSGSTEMMLVSGYSGIGKSCLVHEVHKPIVRQRGYFISGKFDQFKRNIPFAALIQAFQDLMAQLLTETDEKIAVWKYKLLTALGANGQVIIDVIPEVERIIGSQPAVLQLSPSESQNRFNRVFQRFIHVFSQPEHPLVFFLDDLQWADLSSLKLIQLIILDPDSQYLLLIGAYRDNEVSSTHPLMLTLEEIEKTGAIVNNIILRFLNITHVNQLVADTLHTTVSPAHSLAELVFQKTQGNPFFLTQLLKSLYEDNLLFFEFNSGYWQWDIKVIQDINITDNVVELMISEVQRLPLITQNILKLAACVGNKFSLDVLAIINENSQSETGIDLWPALESGLVIPLSQFYQIPLLYEQDISASLPGEKLTIVYKFLHDRVQQASYSLIPDSQKKQTHLKIGELLLKETSDAEQEERIFEIVNHLNIATELVKDGIQREQFAQLNLIAGKKSKTATAYGTAFVCLNKGIELLADDCWYSQYQLTLNLFGEAVEAAFLSGDFAQMERQAKILLHQALSPLDTVKVYTTKIQSYIAQNNLPLAEKTALIILKQLGVEFPEDLSPEKIQQIQEQTKRKFSSYTLEELINLPEMTNPNYLAMMRILVTVVTASHQSTSKLFPLIVCKQIELSLNYGNAPTSASSYSWYGLIQAGLGGDIDISYQSGEAALALVDDLKNKNLKAKTYNIVHAFVRPWKRHAQDSLSPLLETYQIGLDTGELEHGAYALYNYTGISFCTGRNLGEMEQETEMFDHAIHQIRQGTALSFLKIFRQTVLNLRGQADNPCRLVGEAYDEQIMMPQHQANNVQYAICSVYLNKLILGYLFEDYQQAWENAELVEAFSEALTAAFKYSLIYFYGSLTYLAVYQQSDAKKQALILEKVAINQEKSQQWAEYAPMNHLHKFYLVEAERHRVLGQQVEAMDNYEKSIALAAENNYLQEEALANELAAKFHLANHRITVAKTYLKEAQYSYLRWGATAKVEDLKRRYSELLELGFTRTRIDKVDTTQLTTTELAGLDLETVLKASQSISSEILLDKLLAKLMTILIENAGAQTGYLILPTEDEWRIEAIGSFDDEKIAVLQSIPLELGSKNGTCYLPTALINYVVRTQESVILDHAAQKGNFQSDPWIMQHQSKSILCAPLLNRGKLTGIIFLENNLTTNAFTPERIEILRLLSSRAAISIDNARLLKYQAELNASLRAEISDRQKAEKDRDRLIAMLEATTDYVGMADSQGNILWNNAQCRKLLGISSDANLSTLSVANYHPQWALEILQNEGIPAAIRDGSWVGEIALLDSDGREIPVSQMLIAHKATDGSVEYFSTIVRDISTLKAIEAEVRQLNAELEERVKQRTAQLESANKALESFSYSVSHDLRAPLRAIDGFSRMMQEDYSEQLDTEANRYLKIIRDNAKRMGELIDDLLNLSRLDRKAMSKQPVLVNKLIQQVLCDLTPEYSGRQIEFAIADLPICQADRSLLAQVWINLLSNAIKYTSYKSIAHIQIGYEVIDNEGVYFISDNGSGFDMQYADNLFGVFQRLHREQEFKGTGIGLAIVQRIIQRHGGRIWAEAAVDQGATFYFTLPNI